MLEEYETLTVRQEVEMLQAFTGLETKNRYRILDPEGSDVLFAYEESGLIARLLLRSHRPLTITIVNSAGEPQLVARRRFFWFFSHLEMFAPDGGVLGRMQRRFRLLGRRFDVYDAQGPVGQVEGPLLRPNTFWLRRDGVDSMKITKRWSGAAKELFTAADNFQIEFTDSTLSEPMRWLSLGVAFSIDLDFFENRGGGGLSFGLGH